MDYREACELEISPEIAKREIERHDTGMPLECAWTEFRILYGDKDVYLGSNVLDYLGY